MTNRLTTVDQVLLMADLRLLSCAAHFDLSRPLERRRSTQLLEQLFFQLVERFQPEVFIEAGARDAASSRRARKHLKEAGILAFEANPHNFAIFDKKYNNARHRVEYRNCALSDGPDSVTFNVRTSQNGKPRADGEASLLKQENWTSGYAPVTVPATTLDRAFQESAASSCALWIDVEGASQAVLSGGLDCLRASQAIFIEVEDRELWKGQWLKPRIDRLMWDAGLIPVARDFQSKYQFNVLYLSRQYAPTQTSGTEGYETQQLLERYFSSIGEPRFLSKNAQAIEDRLYELWPFSDN